MKLGVVSGPRYYCVGNQYYTETSYHAEMWQECLEVFDEVLLADRAIYASVVAEGQKPVLAKGISFAAYPNFKGFWSILKTLPIIFLKARKIVPQADIWHIHGPSFISFCTWVWLYFYGIPYSLELRGDDSVNLIYLKLRDVKFPRLVAMVMRFILYLQLSNPVAIVGVSRYLIRAFPPRNKCPAFAISDNRISEKIYRKVRHWDHELKLHTIVSLGRVEAQKCPLETMRALHLLDKKGFKTWNFIWIGDGPLRKDAQKLAEELGLSDRVNFVGFVPWDNIFEILNRADLYILNSVSEGLPRALLEAMACALPAVATKVGGIPELLSEEDLVRPLDDECLADKLIEVTRSPERLSNMSERNLITAMNYTKESLAGKKIDFYRQVRKMVQNK